MPLVLSMRSKECFTVGDTLFEVESVKDDRHFIVRDVKQGRSFNIVDTHSTEVMHQVFVSAGSEPPLAMAKVVIDAPPSLRISRGERRRKPETTRG